MCTQKPNNEVETWRNGQGRQFLYILDKETIFLQGIYKIRKTGVWEFQLRNSKQNLVWGSRLGKGNKVRGPHLPYGGISVLCPGHLTHLALSRSALPSLWSPQVLLLWLVNPPHPGQEERRTRGQVMGSTKEAPDRSGLTKIFQFRFR